MNRLDYSEYNFLKFVSINSESPSGLVWVAPRKYVNTLRYERVGTPAGNVREYNNRQKYWVVVLFGKSFFCHRIVWLLHNGTVNVENDIDHIDGDSLNNSISNLREVHPKINCRNTRKRYAGKVLPNGVYYEELYSRNNTLLKRINAHYSNNDDKVVKKNFSVLKYGYDKALSLALEWRIAAIEKLNEQGFGYSERHGT